MRKGFSWTAVLLVLSFSLCFVSLTSLLLISYDNHMFFQILGRICQQTIENQPEAEQAVLEAIKTAVYEPETAEDSSILLEYGYVSSDLLHIMGTCRMYLVIGGFSISVLFFFLVLFFWHKRETANIKTLTAYLEQVNTRGSGLFPSIGEDDFSKLEDELYKTVTALFRTKETALEAKSHFAENLSNIAHQLKTPITSISLSVQVMKEKGSCKQLEQIEEQVSHLTHLEESLLLLSRMDAGVLTLERKTVSVFTLLILAAENLEQLFSAAGIGVSIPEGEEAQIDVDLDWTMEAIMNLMKNCGEHTPCGGTVYCQYEKNPLYTQIQIWDMGSGFAKEDIPHLFERFYRGKTEHGGGIGLGLALSKAIIERQNGTVTARNRLEGGACFEVRFYC